MPNGICKWSANYRIKARLRFWFNNRGLDEEQKAVEKSKMDVWPQYLVEPQRTEGQLRKADFLVHLGGKTLGGLEAVG